MSAERRTYNGLTWERIERESGGEPIWRLLWHSDTGFVLKNYGGPLSVSGFSGVRLVSGGPFREAGQWTTVTDAMADPRLAEYLLLRLAQEATEVKAKLDDLNADASRIRFALERRGERD